MSAARRGLGSKQRAGLCPLNWAERAAAALGLCKVSLMLTGALTPPSDFSFSSYDLKTHMHFSIRDRRGSTKEVQS